MTQETTHPSQPETVSPERCARVSPARIRRRLAAAGAVALAVLGLTGLAAARPQKAAPAPRYVMTAFTNASQAEMSVYTSTDAARFGLARPGAYRPAKGLLRDPSIVRHTDGRYYVAYTTGWDGRTIGLASSTDLASWTHIADLDVGLAGVTNTWAPEWVKDDKGALNLVVSLSSGGRNGPFQPHVIALPDPSAAATAKPVATPMAGLEGNYIDSFIVRSGGRYVNFVKNETTKHIERASAPTLAGPWTFDRTGDWAGWGDWIEGPALTRLPDGGWRIYFDEYREKRTWYSDSRDLDTWTPSKELPGLSGVVRHFTVLEETRPGPALDAASPGRRTISWDERSLFIDGKRQYIWSGEFHPFRLPNTALWPDIFQKMKAHGYNTVAIYVPWGFHSFEKDAADFSGIRNLGLALDMARDAGLYVMIRPGPYMNGEATRGGFPGWLVNQRAKARTDAPEYLQSVDTWFAAVNAVIRKRQLTDGDGTVILYQIENEMLETTPVHVRYMEHLARRARADGITVPIFHNDIGRNGYWVPKSSDVPQVVHGPNDLYAWDTYPGGNCNVDATPGAPNAAPDWGWYGVGGAKGGASASPKTPGFTAEFGGGWFDYWGSNGLYECTARRIGPGYERVFYGTNLANGLTLQSFYMTFGGTSWGWMPAPVVFTSYDYGAAFSETRDIRDKARTMKQLGMFLAAANDDIAGMAKGKPVQSSNERIKIYRNTNPDTGAQLVIAMHNPSSATSDDAFSFTLDGADGTYQLPQAGTLRINGQDAKWLLANANIGRQRLVYSTSEMQTVLNQGARDVALFHGRKGEDGETVLRYASAPKVEVLAGAVTSVFDAARGDLRLNYRHDSLARVRISGGGRPDLLLLLADTPTAETFWRNDTAAGPVLASGPWLVRGMSARGGQLSLTGDTATDAPLEVWAPSSLRTVRWNGKAVAMTAGADGALAARTPLAGPEAISLPDLASLTWERRFASPEADPAFDDSLWRKADARGGASTTRGAPGTPILTAADYGFHHGDVWYRGRYQGGPDARRLDFWYGGGGAGMLQVWVDGRFIGQHELPAGLARPQTTGQVYFDLPESARTPGEHVISVMVRNNGHNWDLFADDAHKEGRGLITASLSSPSGFNFSVPIDWRIQGNAGGEKLADPARGPMNAGGQYGERAGWHMPGARTGEGWERASLSTPLDRAGSWWLRTRLDLDLPRGHDWQLGLAFGDTGKPRSEVEYRVLIFVNGWNMGQFIAHVGPQRTFVLPPGILDPNGRNDLSLVVTTDGEAGNSLEPVRLVALRAARGGVPLSTPSTGR